MAKRIGPRERAARMADLEAWGRALAWRLEAFKARWDAMLHLYLSDARQADAARRSSLERL